MTTLFANDLDLAARSRLAQVIDVHGGRYRTPRRGRAINALRLVCHSCALDIDVPDMVWLQLVRIGKPDLYTWIEEYLTEVVAVGAEWRHRIQCVGHRCRQSSQCAFDRGGC